MIVQSLVLEGFAQYETLTQALASGLSLVVGRNGAGKSTLIEGICWALYGETIRGTNPERPGVQCTAAVRWKAANGKQWQVVRKRSGGKTTLELSEGGRLHNGQTTTETQAKIEAMLGPWERFVCTRVFSREFMARFGAATDKERKALLEGILGLEQFDRALKLAREDCRLQELAVASAQREVQTRGDAVSRMRARLETMEAPARSVATLDAMLKTLRENKEAAMLAAEKLRVLAESMQRNFERASSEDGARRAVVTGLEEQLRKLEQRRARTAEQPDCPVCRRPLDQAALAEHFDAERAELTAQLDSAKQAAQESSAERNELAEERHALTQTSNAKLDEIRRCSEREVTLAQERARALAYEAERARLGSEVEEEEGRRLAAEQAALAGQQRLALIEVATDVLGLRGARTLLLGRALARMEHGANRVLGQLGYPLKVRVSGRTTQKTGKEVDAIGITLEGDGTGDDYCKLSSGERARLDVALMMGLGMVDGALAQGLLAFDEVFDSIDAEGIEPVAAFLGELSQTRQVVVISHHEELRSLFPRGDVYRASRDEGGYSRLEAA